MRPRSFRGAAQAMDEYDVDQTGRLRRSHARVLFSVDVGCTFLWIQDDP